MVDPRSAVQRCTARAETRGWALSEKTMDETTKRLAAEGLKVEAATPAVRAELQKLGETMAAEWVKRAGAEGEAMLKTFRQ